MFFCNAIKKKYEGDKATSESLEAIAKVLDEMLPEIKKASKDVTVNRLVCGTSCCSIIGTHLDGPPYCCILISVSHCTLFSSPFCIVGACLDFKLQVTVPLEDFGPWEER